jgi:hypothetical protein
VSRSIRATGQGHTMGWRRCLLGSFVALWALALVACGGSGSDGTGGTVAPTIATQPQEQTVTVGATATFTVAATGTAPLSYQWYRNTVAISGATNASYTTAATVSGDNGASFTVTVTNAAGSQTSNAAILTVTATDVAPTITTQPQSQTVTVGATATFTVVATGTTPLSYQWFRNSVAIADETTASYTTAATVSGDNGAIFTVKVTNAAGSQTSNAATLTVTAGAVAPTIATQPQSQTVTVGATATFTVVANGTAPLSYQWYRNTVAISGATSASYTTAATVSGDNGASFTVKVTNVAGSQTSNAATLTVTAGTVAPTITTQPQSQAVTVGATATFSVVATGTAPLSYQWYRNTVAISGATSASYTTAATVSGDNGASFTVKVTNAAGSQTSNAATLTVSAGAVAPTITTQPQSQTVTVGATATFSVAATGTAPLSYQWYRNTVAISGATSASYTTAATVSGDNGANFTVKVTNTAGSQTSNAATLTVTAGTVAPTITTQPQSQTVTAGATATFSVAATGTAPFSYQWYKDSVAISGATSASYTTPATVVGDNGASFTATVTNVAGSQTSNAATLTVTAGAVAPTITTQPLDVTVLVGATATFSVVATGTAPLSYQWYRNTVAISGATSSSYTTPGTVIGDNGATFTVTVTNAGGSQTSNPGTLTVNSASGPGTPQIIQHIATTANPAASGAPDGNNYKLTLAPTGAGDTIVLTITGLHGHALTITDSAGDASPSPICSADNGTGNGLSFIYAFQPSAGVKWIQASASGTFAQPFDWQITEFNNIASATAQGSNCQAGLASTSGTVTPSSFTPTNNNSTGGNLIYNYTALATGTNSPNCNASGYTAASGFALLNGDVSAWINGNGYGFPKSTQYEIQTTAAPVVASMAMPGETCSGGSGDPFNSLTIALKTGSAGVANPSTIHVVKAMQLTSTNFNGPNLPASFVIPTPTAGNLRVFMFEGVNPGGYVSPSTTVTSSDGCNYTRVTNSSNVTIMFYAQNCSPCPNCTATFHNSGGGAFANTGGKWYDIENADPSSYQNEADSNPACSGATSISSDPTITPGSTAGIVIGMLLDGLGPTTGISSPSGNVYLCPTYTNQNDNDTMCSGDGHGYLVYSSNTPQNWTWGITSQSSNSCGGMAAAFK